MTTPIAGSDAVWYLMRATGAVSLVLLTVVFALGIATVNRWRAGSLPAFVTASVHRSLALLSVVFVAVHVVTAVTDPYAAVRAVAVVVPFTGSARPLWTGLGAVSLELVAALIVTSLLRRRIGVRAWRAVHLLAYVSWPTAVAHTLGEGTDTGSLWLRATVGACAGCITLAVASRFALRRPGKRLDPRAVGRRARPAAATRRPSSVLD